jgi:hypothetical protein
MIVNDKKKILFIHNPKAMGTSISKALYNAGGFQRIYKKHAKIDVLEDKYDDYFKFGVVRNTYDWLVSAYFYNKTTEGIGAWRRFKEYSKEHDFNSWVSYLEKSVGIVPMASGQLSWFESEDKKTDFLLNMDNLDVDFAKLKKITKLDMELLKQNVNSKRERGHYRRFYNKQSKQIAETLFKEDIERFNYKF